MLKKYLSKFTIDILPSILATIVGAYIVNHYIVPKARDDRPAASAAAIPASKSPESKASDIVDAPDTAPAKPRTVDKGADKPAVEKASIDKSETANAPSEPRRHQPAREKAVAKVTPAPVTPAAVAPALATVGTATTSDDERRDANGLARAAIERLNRSEPRVQDVPRASEAPRAPEAPRVQEVMRTAPTSPSMPQLPPPISVATPSVEKFDSSPAQAERSDSRRFRPPGEIPAPLPMDLQANAAAAPKPERTNVAEDVLSAAKSVFNSVIPHPFER